MVGTDSNTTKKCDVCDEHDVGLTGYNTVCDDCKLECDECGEMYAPIEGFDDGGKCHFCRNHA